jgi:hypothetical protein
VAAVKGSGLKLPDRLEQGQEPLAELIRSHEQILQKIPRFHLSGLN